MMTYPQIKLIDGALIDKMPRKELVEKMARDLIRFDAVANERDSIRSLFGHGYSMIDLVMLIDDARQVAQQEIVAREMGKP